MGLLLRIAFDKQALPSRIGAHETAPLILFPDWNGSADLHGFGSVMFVQRIVRQAEKMAGVRSDSPADSASDGIARSFP
jgi:hypothetical protein